MHRELKTKSKRLFQFRPPEVQNADKFQGYGRNGSGHTVAVQQSRGPSSTSARVEPSPAACPMGAFSENGVSRFFVIDKKDEQLMPCHPERAPAHQKFLLTIRRIDRIRESSDAQPVKGKIDPGAKTTDMIQVRSENKTDHIIHLLELIHQKVHIWAEWLSKSPAALTNKLIWKRSRRFPGNVANL